MGSTPSYDDFVEQVPGRLHGRQLITPIYAATKHSIRAKLHGDRPIRAISKRQSLIIQRANWVTQLTLRLPASGFDRETFELAIRCVRRDKKTHLGLNMAPVYMPSIEWVFMLIISDDADHRARRLQDVFPPDDPRGTPDSEVIDEHRERMYTIDELKGTSSDNLLETCLSEFRASRIAEAITRVIEGAVQELECSTVSKIVAFGDNGILFLGGDEEYIKAGDRCVTQRTCLERARMWSSLLLMREVLESAQGDTASEVPIYVQDTKFREAEVAAFEEAGISVLCGAYGHQQGFVEIDDHTLVVLFRPHADILGLIMEVGDPALLFINEDLKKYVGPLGVDMEASGYSFDDVEIPSGNM